MLVAHFNTLARRIPTAALYILCALPVPWLFYMGATGGLGAEPIKALERELGKIALQLVIAGLAITPLRRFLGVTLLKFRRALGLMAFFYVAVHLAVWLFLDVQIVAQIWADILKRPYVTIGMAGFLLMIPLAMTSNNYALRRLGPTWRPLHKLTYLVAILGAVHFIWLSKGFQFEPLAYLLVILGLLAARIRPQRRKQAV